jgi:hypothetical protein
MTGGTAKTDRSPEGRDIAAAEAVESVEEID